MGLPYNSPTVGLYFDNDGFIEFAENLKYYLKCEPEEIYEDQMDFPVGILRRGDKQIKLYFMHYDSFETAKEKWMRRASRVNFDDLCIVMEHPLPLCEDEVLYKRFKELPYQNKRILTGKTDFEDEIIVKLDLYDDYKPGKILTFKDRFRRYLYDWDYISFLNNMKRGKSDFE